ncbi:phosphatase PAP2 family protein [Marinicella rhabdoformis]|uniref:phosphatase PAP2 family protein n=1 Tax=Marinicella rhabdoformis TaxID=2580566 RepID=UPI0012AEC8F4|nr:phosphatase PAP2 family protein [Marinicella rhabdoformis]
MKPLALIQFYESSLVTKLFGARYYQRVLPVAIVLSRLGDGWLYVLAGLLSLLTQGWEYGYFMTLFWAFVIERPVYYVLKNSLRRDRPFKVLEIQNQVKPSDQFSFPSGHTSGAFVFVAVTASYFPLLLWPLLLFASLIGLSRIILGVHYPTDVLVGAVLGVGLAQLVI